MQTQLDTEGQLIQEISNNPGVIRTYLEGMVPSLLSFLVQLIVAILVLLIGSRIIKFLLKLLRKSLDRSRVETEYKRMSRLQSGDGRCYLFMLTREIFTLFCVGHDYSGTVWCDNKLGGSGTWIGRTDPWTCFAGKPVKFRRWRADTFVEAVCCR